jgi:hypothetical protein
VSKAVGGLRQAFMNHFAARSAFELNRLAAPLAGRVSRQKKKTPRKRGG